MDNTNTIQTICGHDQQKVQAVQKWMSRTCPDVPRTKDMPLSEDVLKIVLMSPALKKSVSETNVLKVPDKQHAPAPEPKPQPTPENKPTPKTQAVTAPKIGRVWLLWLCLAMAVSATTPNMFWVMLQVKGSTWIAAITTLVFTIAPFLLVGYGVKGLAKAAVYAVVCIEVFCNTASFYGGLTGLAHGNFVSPTTFLNMAATMVNRSYEGTALFLSLSMACGIATLAIVPVYIIGKR